MSNNISFKSKIKFIHSIDYLKNHNKGVHINFLDTDSHILKEDKFYTQGIRTCTGGGLVTPHKESLGFHIWDNKDNKRNFDEIANSMIQKMKNIERGLLIGSKSLKKSPYSREQFENFKTFLLKCVPNLTIFEKHKPQCSQSHIAYSLEEDTWLIASDYIDDETEKHYYVTSLEKLRNLFENIKIADGDELFICNKQITKDDAPDLFY